MDSNNQLKEAYRTLNKKVVYGINADSVIDSLFSAGVLSETDNRDLIQISDARQKTRQLLALLQTSGNPAAFVKLHEAIKEDGAYGWLANEIENLQIHSTDVAMAVAKTEKPGWCTGEC